MRTIQRALALARTSALALAVGIPGCAGPSKNARTDLREAPAVTGGADAGGRTADPKNPTGSPSRTPATGEPTVTKGPVDAGKCALPVGQRTDVHCGPYSAERRILCHAFASNKETCLADAPPDGIEKSFYDRLGAHLVVHTTTPGSHPQRSPGATECRTAKVLGAFKIVRLLAEPSESATEVAVNLAGSQDTFTVAQIWGYWSRVSGGGKEGWIVSRALGCP